MSSQWASTALTDNQPHPVAPEHLSLNCLRTVGKFGGAEKMTNVLPYRMFDSSLDFDFDDGFGTGTVRSGVIVALATDTELAIVENPAAGDLVVVWRGTESSHDWQTDLNQWPVHWPYGGAGADLRCPSGFVACHESVAEPLFKTLRAILEKKTYKRIVVCGHSLGGALAHMNTHALTYKLKDCIDKLDNHPADRLCCYTYGSPCPGTKPFAMDFSKTVQHCYRFVNDEDLVPRLSSFAFYTKMVGGLHHVGVEILMDEDYFVLNPAADKRALMTDPSYYNSEMITDHTIDRYHELICFHRLRFFLATSDPGKFDQIIQAWVTYVSGRKQKTPKLELIFPVTVVDDDILANAKKIQIAPRYSYVPNDYGLIEELAAVTGSPVDKETMKLVLLYARKCIISHIFDPNGEVDDENVTFVKFVLSVWEMLLQPDAEKRAAALRVARLRFIFDQLDLDKSGFITKNEFKMIFKEKMDASSGSVLAPGLDKVDRAYMKMYDISGVKRDFAKNPIQGVSFWEFELWAATTGQTVEGLKTIIRKGLLNLLRDDLANTDVVTDVIGEISK